MYCQREGTRVCRTVPPDTSARSGTGWPGYPERVWTTPHTQAALPEAAATPYRSARGPNVATLVQVRPLKRSRYVDLETM